MDGGIADAKVGDALDAYRDQDPSPPNMVLFEDDFDGLGPPYLPEFAPPSFVPAALFPDDGSRWTQIQNSAPDRSWIDYDAEHQALRFFAVGLADNVASKMDVGRDAGIELGPGMVVRLAADVFVEGGGETLPDNTLIDLEDTDDLTLDGMVPGAGLRLRTDQAGRLALDRGELLGSDAAEPPHFRLQTLRSDYRLPVGRWVRIEAIVRLGVGVPMSTEGPLDMTFDAHGTRAWCEIWVEPRGSERQLVMRQKGTTFLDRETGLALLAAEAPGFDVQWPTTLDYNSLQVGLTNNRSTLDRQMLVDNVQIERLNVLE